MPPPPPPAAPPPVTSAFCGPRICRSFRSGGPGYSWRQPPAGVLLPSQDAAASEGARQTPPLGRVPIRERPDPELRASRPCWSFATCTFHSGRLGKDQAWWRGPRWRPGCPQCAAWWQGPWAWQWAPSWHQPASAPILQTRPWCSLLLLPVQHSPALVCSRPCHCDFSF